MNQHIGHGFSIAHHGEILQGIFEDQQGQMRRGLVSLPYPLGSSCATFTPKLNLPVTVSPGWKIKACHAVELTLHHFNLEQYGGHINLTSNLPPQWGFGSSTCDITSAIRAVADAFDHSITPLMIAKIAIAAEQASDPLMISHGTVLFAHRDGTIIENFGYPLPSMEVVGFNTDPTEKGVNTVAFPPADYTWWEVEAFRPLRGLLRHAIHTQSARLVGQVALASARINNRYLPKPHFDQLEKLVESSHALGFQVSHSGTIVGLLFAPNNPDLHLQIEYAKTIITELGFGKNIYQFSTSIGQSPDNIELA